MEFNKVTHFIKSLYGSKGEEIIPLHEPRFQGNEIEYMTNCIKTGFVSSVGQYVNQFEKSVSEYTGSRYAIATVNGTAALHISLILAGVKKDDEVITQPLTFIATVNAISYAGAHPVFLDVDKETLGLSHEALESFLSKDTTIKDNNIYNKKTGRRIAACVPMHTFGHPAKIDEIKRICEKYNIVLVEDAAESLGSKYKNVHTGLFGKLGVLSFNGNKTITTGGGGMIITNDESLAIKAKHLTTQAKLAHPWEYFHDEIGYNYRLPNINAALGCAQMEELPSFIEKKREIARKYRDFFSTLGIYFVDEPANSFSNFWLNAILLNNRKERDEFLTFSHKEKIFSRPAWQLAYRLPMYSNCQKVNTENAEWIEDRLVNLPSSVII